MNFISNLINPTVYKISKLSQLKVDTLRTTITILHILYYRQDFAACPPVRNLLGDQSAAVMSQPTAGETRDLKVSITTILGFKVATTVIYSTQAIAIFITGRSNGLTCT